MNFKTLCFDIETIPDMENARLIYDIDKDLSHDEAWNIIRIKRMEKAGNDFLPHFLQKIIAISIIYQDHQQIKITTLGQDGESEKEIIERLFLGIEKSQPTLVSWNGQGFDLPVLQYRTILHHIQAPIYWEAGEKLNDFKWNNYTHRYHQRHTDVMDVLSSYQGKAFAPLDEFSQILGLPGKIGLHGSEVYPAYLNGELQKICDYCESDVLNTYLIYLRYLWSKGSFTKQQYLNLLTCIEEYLLKQAHKTHWHAFVPYLEQTKNLILE
jgi:predicted PolB exonuclease-like 3'-5' exonuclease